MTCSLELTTSMAAVSHVSHRHIRPGLDCSDVSFGGFRIGLFFLFTVVRVGSNPALDEKEEGSPSVSTADLDVSTSDTDCTGHFG